MDKIEVSLRDLIDTCTKKNLMMMVDEDVLKFLILEMFKQLAILREAGASHGDVKPENLMLGYKHTLTWLHKTLRSRRGPQEGK